MIEILVGLDPFLVEVRVRGVGRNFLGRDDLEGAIVEVPMGTRKHRHPLPRIAAEKKPPDDRIHTVTKEPPGGLEPRRIDLLKGPVVLRENPIEGRSMKASGPILDVGASGDRGWGSPKDGDHTEAGSTFRAKAGETKKERLSGC